MVVNLWMSLKISGEDDDPVDLLREIELLSVRLWSLFPSEMTLVASSNTFFVDGSVPTTFGVIGRNG